MKKTIGNPENKNLIKYAQVGVEPDDWTGALIGVKPEWLNPGERDIPYLVTEDRGDRILVYELPQYSKLHIGLQNWCWSKDWCYIIDKDLLKRADPDFVDPTDS